jgi:hypothetical protein
LPFFFLAQSGIQGGNDNELEMEAQEQFGQGENTHWRISQEQLSLDFRRFSR